MLAIKTLTPKSVIFRREVRLMGDRFEISVVGNDLNWAEDCIDKAVAEINRVEKLLSVFNEDSPVNEINRNAGIKPVKTSSEIYRLVDRSMQILEITHGAFDITYYKPVADNAVNEDTTLKIAAKKSTAGVSYQNVILDEKAQTVFLAEPGMRIGFGANSKGYAADRARYILLMHGVRSGVINAGGDLLAWGTPPDNDDWTIAIADPSQKGLSFANLNISNMAVATLVNIEKKTAVIDKKYLSVINPKKGFPVSSIHTVSVISTSAELADALAAPIVDLGINASLYLINKLNQVGCVIIDDHNRVYTSKGIALAL